MSTAANPLNPKDEDAVVDMLNSGLAVAKKYKVKHRLLHFLRGMAVRQEAEGKSL